MSVATIDDGFHLLDRVLKRTAAIQVRLDRNDADDFVVLVEPLGNSSQVLPKNAAFSLIPSGSNWMPALGWRSFFGHFWTTAKGEWFVVGMEGGVPHPTRGANPVLHAYLFPHDKVPVDGLRGMVADISQLPFTVSPYGVIAADSESPEAHKPIEAAIIAAGADAYEAGAHLLFRTLILCEQRLPEDMMRSRNYLIGTAPGIRNGFSRTARFMLRLETHVFQGQPEKDVAPAISPPPPRRPPGGPDAP